MQSIIQNVLRRRRFSPASSSPTAAALPPGVLSSERAVELFKVLLTSPYVPSWDQLRGGCEYRADVAAQHLLDAGCLTFKAWAFPALDAKGKEAWCLAQQRQNPVTASTFHTWRFHAAAAAFIVTSQVAMPQLTVFDPTLIDGPCTPERWMRAMSASRRRFMLTYPEVFLIDASKNMAFVPSPSQNEVHESLIEMGSHNDATLPRLKAEEDE